MSIKMKQIELGNITVDVEQKNIKNIHLSVYPPTGRVRIAAPNRFDLETIRMFAISKLSWIKKQQQKLRKQTRETPNKQRVKRGIACSKVALLFPFGSFMKKTIRDNIKRAAPIRYKTGLPNLPLLPLIL